MATKKAGGSTRLGRDSNPQYPGLKRADGQMVYSGEVLLRQRGSKILPGINVKIAKDDTLYAISHGILKFTRKRNTDYTGKTSMRKVLNVFPK